MKVLVAALLFLAAAASPAIAQPAPESAPEPAKEPSIEEQRRYFTEDPVAPMIAPEGYDVTIVEYMDYQCPNCRASREPLKKLLAKDKKVRVIFRDWPIFGPKSEAAALIAIAAKYQGKYLEVHDALMEAPLPLDTQKIEAAARKAGADWDRLQKDMAANTDEILDLFHRNDEQAQMIGLEGTPGFLIGNVQFFGGMTLEQFETAVANARKANGKAAAAEAKGPARAAD